MQQEDFLRQVLYKDLKGHSAINQWKLVELTKSKITFDELLIIGKSVLTDWKNDIVSRPELKKILPNLTGRNLDRLIELSNFIYTAHTSDVKFNFYVQKKTAINLVNHLKKINPTYKYLIVQFDKKNPAIPHSIVDCNHGIKADPKDADFMKHIYERKYVDHDDKLDIFNLLVELHNIAHLFADDENPLVSVVLSIKRNTQDKYSKIYFEKDLSENILSFFKRSKL